MVRQATGRVNPLRAGIYLLYLAVMVFAWIFAILYFNSALQHASDLTDPAKLRVYWTAIIQSIFFALLGVFSILIVIADLKFEITGKWFMDIPLDIFGFDNAKWWEIPVGIGVAAMLLLYSSFTQSLIVPLPFATIGGGTGSTAPEAVKIFSNPLQQAGLTAMVGPLENAAMISFPIATLMAWIMFLIFRKSRFAKTGNMTTYMLVLAPISLLVGGLAVLAHSLIYPPQVMQATATSTFIFFSIGGFVTGMRRSNLLWDTVHFTYNFGAIFFAIVTLTVSVFA